MSGFFTAVVAIVMAAFFTHLTVEKTLDLADVKTAEEFCIANNGLDQIAVGEFRLTIYCTNGAMFNIQKATYQ